MKLAINASRARSGGAKSHLVGILSEVNPYLYGFKEVHVWSYGELLSLLPKRPWLKKHIIKMENKSILKQLWWEFFLLPKEIRQNFCNILLNVDAGTVCRFQPYVVMSRDMLSYEPGEMYRYGISFSLLRLIIIKFVQNSSLKNSMGSIFLSKYAGNVIQKSTGLLRNTIYIQHGVSDNFRSDEPPCNWPEKNNRSINCLYVSNIAPYKHQWNVIRAIKKLRKEGFNLNLTLTGGGIAGGNKIAQALLKNELDLSDPQSNFVKNIGFIEQEKLPNILKKADIFIFASSCENMPNTLLEAMASGLPIACSNRGPMPEILQSAGVYFDPEKPINLANAIKKLIQDKNYREKIAKDAMLLSTNYSWKRCSKETFLFLKESVTNYQSKQNG